MTTADSGTTGPAHGRDDSGATSTTGEHGSGSTVRDRDSAKGAPQDVHSGETNNSNPVNRRIIAEFRANGGQVGGHFAGVPLLLLTTRGARTGLHRTTPLVYLRDGDRLIVFASNGGAPAAPGWFHNLVKDPTATVEVGTERFPARASLVDEREHDALWDRQIAADPGFAEFRRRAGRTIPLVALRRAA
ncbi:nitroreductase family deazaflavin-dependent oxidoreductase [Goodfellowiella coeruleoviolacea]|uniref:Deazaflavin-dependent oxidoreductase, nitroreductase family n=1 Tax=Goodfellowiella coeruleoviolacea TaxID=334858 RepID=A0AAE3GHM1_9PSEU|nr:nitroreductase family deazaflavin-dependent oxidoreductase [Goodfellowiella coeruleoviolacea]MCP2168406.1 deazaflavin-dependent oxidoreductase, nitroreductase family [Goodfellowiella coeruleoviolacea]